MVKPPGIVIALLVVLLLVLVPLALAPDAQVLSEHVVRIEGRLQDAATGRPISHAVVLGLARRAWAADRAKVEACREQIEEDLAWIRAYNADFAMGLFPSRGSNAADTDEQGAFAMLIRIVRCYRESFFGSSRPSQPPERSAIGALRIEIEGRDPVILDVPEGTWTQHDGGDGLWATWDLGVVEVPGRP